MMQKSEFQISGYLHRRGNDNTSWSNRYVTLSTDTGAMKLYMEKSGKRTIKGQLNIKKSRLTEVGQEQVGRVFALELVTEDLKGKSDEATLILAAPDQDQYEEWKKAFSVCFTIGDSRRRRSILSESTPSMSTDPTTPGTETVVKPSIETIVLEKPPVAAVPVEITAAAAPVEITAAAAPVEITAAAVPVEITVADVPSIVESLPNPNEKNYISTAIPPAVPDDNEDDLPGVQYVDDENLDYEDYTTNNLAQSAETEKSTAMSSQLPRLSSEDAVDRSILNALINAQQNVDRVSATTVDAPTRSRSGIEVERKASVKFDDEPLTVIIEGNSHQPHPEEISEAPSTSISETSPLSKIFGDSPTNIENSPAPTTIDSELSSEMGSPAPEKSAVAQKLEKKMARLSFKKPNFKNLLNDNGLDDEMKQELEVVAEVKQTGGNTPRQSILKKEPEPAKPVRIPRQLSITVRPIETTRVGYIQKLDSSSLNELGEDSWLDQYASLEIATGEMKLFAEIGGRRILRGSINVNDHIARSIDYVFYGKVFPFEFVIKNEDGTPSEQAAAVFAADDLETYSYWMISFQDCKDHLEQLRLEELARQEQERLRQEEEKRKQEEEEEAAAAHANALAMRQQESRKSFRPFDGGASIFSSFDDIEGVQLVQYTETDSIRSSPSTVPEQHLVPEFDQSSAAIAKASSSSLKSTPSSNRLLSAANISGVSTLKSVPSMHERIPTASNIRNSERHQPAYRGMSLDHETMDIHLQRFRSHSAAPDLQHPLSAIFNPTSFGGPPHDSDPLDMLSPATALIMQQMAIPEVENLSLDFSKIHYPMERLARRIKIWYCSSGFSITSEKEVENFVRELRNTDDKVLHAFSHEKFAFLNDWAKLLEMLRKYEEHSALDPRTHESKLNPSPEEAELVGHMAFIMKAKTKGAEGKQAYAPVTVAINEALDLEPVVRKLANDFSISEDAASTKLLGMLSKQGSALADGLKTLKDDLTFAEDLVLYQEEVIEHMWQSYTALKGLIEQKDTVINQLYSQLSEYQEKYRSVQLGTDALQASGVFQSTATIKKLGGDVPDNHEMKIIADREFNNADKDGDGRISREEWRKWIEDKHNLIQEHNQVKAMLMDEIKILRKAMNPHSQQVFDDLKRTDEIRHRVEEELIRSHITNDNLREDLATISIRLKDVEQEKFMLESDWQEKLAALTKELAETKAKLAETEHEVEDLKAKQAPFSINPGTPLRIEGQHTHGYGYNGFSPMQFPSYSAPRGASLNPYAYNMPDDRVMGSASNSIAGGIAMDSSVTGIGNQHDGNYGALDLQAIANSDVADLSQQQQMPGFGSPLMTHPAMMLLHQQQFLIQQQQQQLQQASHLLASSNSVSSTPIPPFVHGSASNNFAATQTPSALADKAAPRRSFTAAAASSDAYLTPHHMNALHDDGDMMRGASSNAPYEFRSPDDDDEYVEQSFLHHAQRQQQQEGDMTAQPQQHNKSDSGQHGHGYVEEMYNEAKGREPSPPLRQQQQQQVPQFVFPAVQRSMDHPLRNALRNEVRHKNNPVALVQPAASGGGIPLSIFGRKPNGRRSPTTDPSTEQMRAASPPASRTPSTPSYAAPIARRTNTNVAGTPGATAAASSTGTMPKTPSNQPIVVDEGRVGGSGRAGSPSRFMQGTNSWKKKAIPADRSAQDNIIMRASNWR